MTTHYWPWATSIVGGYYNSSIIGGQGVHLMGVLLEYISDPPIYISASVSVPISLDF